MGKRVVGVTGAVSDSGAWLMSRVYRGFVWIGAAGWERWSKQSW